jgi:hypothetical protein
MRFARYPRWEPYEVTPRKLAAARRAVQREKDRYPLFPELLTHQTAEKRLEAIATSRDEWWQDMRDHQAKQWRRAANLYAHYRLGRERQLPVTGTYFTCS